MKQKEFLLVIFSTLCFLAIGPAQALAEGFIDIYGGWASTRDADVDGSISSSSLARLSGFDLRFKFFHFVTYEY
jgi:hypothetical protein